MKEEGGAQVWAGAPIEWIIVHHTDGRLEHSWGMLHPLDRGVPGDSPVYPHLARLSGLLVSCALAVEFLRFEPSEACERCAPLKSSPKRRPPTKPG